MQNKTESAKQSQTEPRKLNKPAREEQEMKREELVAYSDESGGGPIGGGTGPS